VTYRQLTRQLTGLGYQLYRQAAGSHEIWWHPVSGLRTTIPNHGSRDIPVGTLAKILRDLNLSLDELRRS
jgi:predicted RNA binding protein YcfA (HicA-like mRNA interferase family)